MHTLARHRPDLQPEPLDLADIEAAQLRRQLGDRREPASMRAAAGRLLVALLRDGRGYLDAADADALDLIPECYQVRIWPRNRDVIGVHLLDRPRKAVHP